ncbi:MAG: HlyC/CorC family transporter [Clostridiales bacterium]|jgi:CBS domain containing-hemolysin-like protein|nr:HlyC/CorC family transporter [Clostridiales bacterium]
MTLTDIITTILIIIFVILSAFYSSAEIAFAKANAIRIKKQAESGDKTAKREKYINDNYTMSLSTLLVGNNLVNIAASSAATVLFVAHLGQAKGQSVATVVITLVIITFGETLPKIIASAIPDKLARFYALPLRFSMIVYYPMVRVVDKMVKWVEPFWTPKEKAPLVTAEELYEMVDNIEDEGVFTEDEGELIKSAIEFTDTNAMDILVPRVDVFAIDIDEEIQITDEFYRYSRIPVYRGSIDNIIGILPTKKLLREIAAGNEYNLEEMLNPPIFVHMTKTVSSIIDEFRKKRQQLAVVVDEYGGTAGILTMEDITEEIVGNIFDERDLVEDDIRKVGENLYEVDGSTNIYDLFDTLDWEPSDFETEYTTVGGWATEMLDKFPENGDNFVYKCLKVTVLEAKSMRVEKLLVEFTPPAEEE